MVSQRLTSNAHVKENRMSSSQRNITIEDLYKYKPVGHPRISPDGKRIAFVVTATDERLYKYRSSIWIVPAEGGEARQFTAGPANAQSPAWSPDGNWLAFVSERESDLAGKDEKDAKKLGKGKPQIWIIPTNGGEAQQVTFMQHGASSPTW